MESPSPSSRGITQFRWLLIIGAFVIALLFITRFIFPGRTSAPSDLPRIYSVPPFALTERSGKPITNNELFGKIWVADFVYTTCPGPCPVISADMARIQKAVANDPMVQLVTFTVDPQTDTPAVLSAYADHLGADKDRWWFLTGSEKAIYSLIHDGFREAVEDNSGRQLEPGQYKVTHSTQLALVDANGLVRGYYDGLSENGRHSLLKAIKTLEKESP